MTRPTTKLSEVERKELLTYVKASVHYKYHQAFFESCDPDLLIDRAVAYCVPKSVELDRKIQDLVGYARKRLESLKKHLRTTAAEIRRLNTTELPGGVNFIEVLRLLGPSTDGPDVEYFIDLAARFERLPTYLEEYGDALRQWPHPAYRKWLSDRNWGTFRLAELCLWVRAVTNEFHYDKIASLLTAVAEFAQRRVRKPPPEVITPDLVRHNLGYFQERNPLAYEYLEQKTKLAADRYKEERLHRNELVRK